MDDSAAIKNGPGTRCGVKTAWFRVFSHMFYIFSPNLYDQAITEFTFLRYNEVNDIDKEK